MNTLEIDTEDKTKAHNDSFAYTQPGNGDTPFFPSDRKILNTEENELFMKGYIRSFE